MTDLPGIADGALAAYFIFDVADTIDLESISKKTNVSTEPAQLRMRPVAAPSYIAFPVPPLSVALPDIQLFGNPARTRLKVYDYGVMSLRIEIPFSGSWSDFYQLARNLRSSEELITKGRTAFDGIKGELREALRKPHSEELMEDYFVFTVHDFDRDITAETLMERYGRAIAGLVRGEQKPLGPQEVAETMRLQLSYFETDLCIVEWDAAFVYDRPDAAATIEGILEFANTQLVELRTYDKRLDAELDWIYASDPVHRKRGPFSHRAANQRAERLRLMLVDIGELLDRTNNALKLVGDAFYARVYRNVRSRLGLGDWERQIDQKMQSVSAIYGFLTDQSQNMRSEVLEWIVITLIFVEVVMGFFRK